MSVLENAKIELLDRLANNTLQDTDDLTAYIQYACRLMSLGDHSKIDDFAFLFAKEQFAGKISDIIKERCKQGWFEIANYPGEDLALSLIDAQDFYLFERQFGKDYPEIKPYFRKWWDDCEDVGIDEECAEFLEKFLETFPIPEEERLPVINTPITEREWALLDFAYRNVELPLIELTLQPSQWTKKQNNLYDSVSEKLIKRPTLLLATGDGKPADSLKKIMQTDSTVKIKDRKLYIETQLDDAWQFHISIEDESNEPIAIDRVRIGNIPAFQDEKNSSVWNFRLKIFDDNKRKQLLEQSIFVQLSNGYRFKCSLPFI
ncbi:MAG: hypothetical protein LBU34_11135 [Planctomycetaceae bacterium]|jgi:hypothetical protein|nr:hypothetical protein [Planctomycetaceae bacterium]